MQWSGILSAVTKSVQTLRKLQDTWIRHRTCHIGICPVAPAVTETKKARSIYEKLTPYLKYWTTYWHQSWQTKMLRLTEVSALLELQPSEPEHRPPPPPRTNVNTETYTSPVYTVVPVFEHVAHTSWYCTTWQRQMLQPQWQLPTGNERCIRLHHTYHKTHLAFFLEIQTTDYDTLHHVDLQCSTQNDPHTATLLQNPPHSIWHSNMFPLFQVNHFPTDFRKILYAFIVSPTCPIRQTHRAAST